MTYDPNTMPRTIEEFNQCVDHYFQKSKAGHDVLVAQVKAQAEASLPQIAR